MWIEFGNLKKFMLLLLWICLYLNSNTFLKCLGNCVFDYINFGKHTVNYPLTADSSLTLKSEENVALSSYALMNICNYGNDIFKFLNILLTLLEKCPNTEFFCSIFSCIQSNYKKIRTRKKNPYLDTFNTLQIILFLNVIWSKVIGNNNGIHELPYELPNDLSLWS